MPWLKKAKEAGVPQDEDASSPKSGR
jgi:hypothetical protein